MSVEGPSARFNDLSEVIHARLWSGGFMAEPRWVEWLLGLEVRARARRAGSTVRAAEEAMTVDEAVELADELIETARR